MGILSKIFQKKKYYQLSPEDQVALPYNQDGLWTHHYHDFMNEPGFQAAISRAIKASGEDFRSHWRIKTALWAAKSALGVQGAFIECGVGYGYTASAIMQALDWRQVQRPFFLIDTFSGLDLSSLSKAEDTELKKAENQKNLKGKYNTSYELAQKNFSEWPEARVIKGIVPEILESVSNEHFAFAHIDMNCAEPESQAFAFIWPRLSPGGIILFDDYVYYGYHSQKLALDAMAKQLGADILPMPTGQGMVIKR